MSRRWKRPCLSVFESIGFEFAYYLFWSDENTEPNWCKISHGYFGLKGLWTTENRVVVVTIIDLACCTCLLGSTRSHLFFSPCRSLTIVTPLYWVLPVSRDLKSDTRKCAWKGPVFTIENSLWHLTARVWM